MAEFDGESLGALLSVHETGAAMATHEDVINLPAGTGRIQVMYLVVTADAASTFELQSNDGAAGVTPITPAHGLGINGQLILGNGRDPVAIGLPGERLDVDVGGTGPVNYSMWYRIGP